MTPNYPYNQPLPSTKPVEIFPDSWQRIVKDVLFTGPRSEGCSQVAELNYGRFDGEERNGKNP